MNFRIFVGYINLAIGTATMAANFVDNDPRSIIGFLLAAMGALILSDKDKP